MCDGFVSILWVFRCIVLDTRLLLLQSAVGKKSWNNAHLYSGNRQRFCTPLMAVSRIIIDDWKLKCPTFQNAQRYIAQGNILPKDIMPNMTICLWRHFAQRFFAQIDNLPKEDKFPKTTFCPYFRGFLFKNFCIINPKFWWIIADSFYDNAAENKLDMYFKPHKHELYLFNRERDKR